MNKNLFLFSNLIFISKINCIDLSKVEVFLDNKKVKTEKYIKKDESDDESPVALIDGKKVSISKIEVELQDDTLNFINNNQIKNNFENKKLKKIKFYLVDHKNCCKKFSIKIDKKCNYFNDIPFEIIVYFYKLFAKDINKKDLNVDIFSSYKGEPSINNYVDFGASGYSCNWKNKWKLDNLYITNISIKSKDKKEESIIKNNDNEINLIEKLEKLKDFNVSFIVESKKFDDKNIDVHCNFDNINDENKLIRTFPSHPDDEITYEFFNKKNIKLKGSTVDKYEPLFKNLPKNLSFIKVKNKYKKDEFLEKIRDDIKDYVKKVYKNSVFDIDTFFPKEKIKVYKKEKYLNNNEEKVEIEDNKDIYCDEVFVEFKAEDIIKFYAIIPLIHSEPITCNVKFETSNENLKDKNLNFEYSDLLSDYLKENIFCQNGFEFVKDINNYKVIYQNKEYNPGEHIDIDPKISTDIVFKLLEKDEDINKKIKDQEAKKQALIAKIKADLDKLKSNITTKMTSNDLRNKLNTIINGTVIEDQECTNLINEINVEINEKVQKELKSTNDITKKHKLVNDALKNLLNNSKEKTVTDLQTSLNNILANGYNPDEENKKLIDKIKNKINDKKTNNKNEKTDNVTDKNINNNTNNNNKTGCCAKYKSNK